MTDKNFTKVAPQGVQDKVNEAIKAVSEGTIQVGTAIGDETGAAETLRESVRP